MIYNECNILRAIILAIPYIGGSLDMILYKKGNDTEIFTAGEDLKDGDNCYLSTQDGKFYKASAISAKTSSTIIVKALQKIRKEKKGVFLVKGKYYTRGMKTGTLYLSTNHGKLTHEYPTGTDNVIRVISTALNEKEEYFSPSSDWITHI